MTTAATATQNAAMRPEDMASPPDEVTGVVIALRDDESMTMLEWIVQSMYATEQRIEGAGDNPRPELYEDLTTLMTAAQSCSSAAAASMIYRDPYHFIFLEKQDAISIIRMMFAAQTMTMVQPLYRKVIYQVDQAFIKQNEFANVPVD